jgi:hypothetical protein
VQWLKPPSRPGFPDEWEMRSASSSCLSLLTTNLSSSVLGELSSSVTRQNCVPVLSLSQRSYSSFSVLFSKRRIPVLSASYLAFEISPLVRIFQAYGCLLFLLVPIQQLRHTPETLYYICIQLCLRRSSVLSTPKHLSPIRLQLRSDTHTLTNPTIESSLQGRLCIGIRDQTSAFLFPSHHDIHYYDAAAFVCS